MLLLCLLILFALKPLVSSQNVCSSEECKRASQLILNNMDTTVDPCVDMYQFSCGGWIQKNVIPNYRSSWSIFDLMDQEIQRKLIELIEEDGWTFKGKNSTAVKKLKQYYKSCLDVKKIEEKGAEPLKKLIDDHGSWTVTQTNRTWNWEKWELQEALQESHKLKPTSLWETSLWLVYIYKDEKNASRNIINLYQSGLTLDKYVTVYNRTSIKKHYMNIAMTVGQLLGGDNNTVEAKMSQVYNFEKSLAEIHTSLVDLDNPKNSYNLMTLRQFQEMIGDWIDMEKYMEAIFGKGVVTSDVELIVKTPGYFEKLKDVINSTNKEVLANYIMWHLIMNTMGYLPKEFSVADVFVMQPGKEIKEMNPRQNKCLRKARRSMYFVTSALYVDRHFSLETVVKVVTALDDIEHQFISNLNNLTWLDDETKKNLTEKAQAMTNQVGYPDWILNPIKLDAMYENLVVEEEEYFQNFFHFARFQNELDKITLLQSPDKNKWDVSPDYVNAYYYSVSNMVVILAGILQEPIVSTDHPTAYLYGSLGTILGHEIIHGFDNRGRMFDKDGHLKDIWTPHVAEEFDKRAQCFVDQYNNFTVYGYNLNGQLTLGENIADNGGIKLAYRAYKSSIKSQDLPLPGLNLTNDQLFFVGLGQFFCSKSTKSYDISLIRYAFHSHNHVRVLGSASNSKEFSEAFNCPVNSPMNPEKKCEVW